MGAAGATSRSLANEWVRLEVEATLARAADPSLPRERPAASWIFLSAAGSALIQASRHATFQSQDANPDLEPVAVQ